MKKIVLFDPSYGTSNMGDTIIGEAVMKHMDFLFSQNFLVRYSTHSPLMHLHQLLKKNFISKNCAPSNLKFLGGSNIFKHNLLKYTLDWNINILTKGLYRNSVSIGAGIEGSSSTINRYTRYIYKSILSKNYIHSTRDEVTKEFLESLGFKAINTGCPTLWDLTDTFCKTIPSKKADNVVFTLTDYSKDVASDQALIKELNASYKVVYFWVQGTGDLEYLKTLKDTYAIKIIHPHLSSYQSALEKGNIDYIGTRLHAGIYAMNKKVRSIILVVDNRTQDMKASFNLHAVPRNDIAQLHALIHSNFSTKIRVDQDKIRTWKNQFKNTGDAI
jgi:Polysaccharide pyruvyl transferase